MPAHPSVVGLDPAFAMEVPGIVRAGVAFCVVLGLGAVILWRFDGVVDRSIAASIDRPLSSLGYGVAAHAAIAFFGIYAASQLAQLPVSNPSLGSVGVWVGLLLLVLVAALGFTVVGAAVVEARWGPRRWHGLVLGAAIAGLAGLLDPLVGALVWVVIVSTGIGGPVRVWFHASEDVDAAT